MISSAMKLVCCQPPYVKRIGTSAAPRATATPTAPAGQARRKRPSRLAQAHEATPRPRRPRPQLDETEGTDERDDAPQDPRRERELGRPDALRHRGGRPEDPPADDAADHRHGAGEETESPRIGGHGAEKWHDRCSWDKARRPRRRASPS